MDFATVNTKKGGCVYQNNAIVSKEDYSPEDWAKLCSGEEIPCAWDEDGEPIAWDFLSDD